MTGCMYVLPTVVGPNRIPLSRPVALADTIATLDGRENLPYIIPTNADLDNIGNDSRGILYRKLYIIDDICTVAFAGNGGKIRECYRRILEIKDKWLNSDRPMQYVEDVANSILPDIWVLGGAIIPEKGILNTIYPPGPSYNFGRLGNCYVSGSGTPDLLRNAHQFDTITAPSRHIPAGMAGQQFAIDTNIIRLLEEVNGKVDGWGGYVEHSYLDPNQHRWVRGPRTLHLFMNAEKRPGDEVALVPFPRMVAYDPGPETGRLLSVAFEPSVARIDFALRNLLSEANHKDDAPEGFWDSWKPEIVTIGAILSDEIREDVFIVHIIEHEIDRFIEFSLDEYGPYFKISDETRYHLGNIAANHYGRKYAHDR